MSFEIRDTDLAGRIGRLCTRHGCIETPAFFPVIDVYRQEVSTREISEIGFNQVITNSYLILKRYGEEAVERGVHGLLDFNGVVMTDSGAYQILEYGSVDVDQETIMEFQARIGSDIAVILDIPTGDVDRATAARSVEETLRRARAAIPLIQGVAKGPLWVLPIQGGRHLDLVAKSAEEAARIHEAYDIFGVGSPTVFLERYEYRTIIEMILTAKSRIPWGKPVHLFGAGHPLIIPLAVAAGIDMFDSASYILYARDDRYITEYGVERLERLEYFPCNCPVCSRYTPKDLLEMPKRERTRLLAIHNLYMILKSIRRTKQAIREGRLWELVEEVSHRHPRALDAVKALLGKSRVLEKGTPRSKGVVRGLRFYGPTSYRRPKLERFRAEVERYLTGRPGPRRAVLIPYPEDTGSCPTDPMWSDQLVAFYAPFIGLVPRELCGVYPTTHNDMPRDPEAIVIEETAEHIASLLHKLGYERVEIVPGVGSLEKLARFIAERLSRRGVEVIVAR